MQRWPAAGDQLLHSDPLCVCGRLQSQACSTSILVCFSLVRFEKWAKEIAGRKLTCGKLLSLLPRFLDLFGCIQSKSFSVYSSISYKSQSKWKGLFILCITGRVGMLGSVWFLFEAQWPLAAEVTCLELSCRRALWCDKIGTIVILKMILGWVIQEIFDTIWIT